MEKYELIQKTSFVPFFIECETLSNFKRVLKLKFNRKVSRKIIRNNEINYKTLQPRQQSKMLISPSYKSRNLEEKNLKFLMSIHSTVFSDLLQSKLQKTNAGESQKLKCLKQLRSFKLLRWL